MSLIESALEKLRRGADREVDASLRAETPAVASVVSAKIPVVPAPAEQTLERITIDTAALRSRGYLPELGLERRFADHYRQIKRPLIEKALSGGPEMRILVVASALPGDGKTFTSINLALSMARERDASVLLIDADGPKARVSEVLGLKGKRGLLDALADESIDVESLVVRTDIRGLELLPAGRFIENATELLASDRMRQIVTRIAARNPRRLVLLDSAPLLVSSEARVLHRVAGQVVLVVRAGATPRQAVSDAIAQVDKSKLQGLIINQAVFRKDGGYYDYGSYGALGEGAETSD